ncbi:MAG: cell division protein FtsZ, partial [Candidatus Bathyarchaeia archaeon]
MVLVDQRLSNSIVEEKIAEAALMAKPVVSVVGIGGAGSNIISWIKQRGMVGGQLIALNTDVTHLSTTKADKRVLIGERTCGGFGSGGYPRKGEAAMRESLRQVVKELQDSNIIFIVAGLGGGTGTGASYVLADHLRAQGKLVIGVVTLPFLIERVRMEIARKGLERLRKACDTVVAIDNNKLVRVAGNLAFKQALGVANELVGIFVKDITETIATASLINIDYVDLRTIMKNRGLAAIGVGYAQGEERVERAVKAAMEGQLLDIGDITMAKGVLIHVSGGEDMTLEDVTKAGEIVMRMLPQETKIVWGARVNEGMEGSIHVMVILTGIESAF